MFNCKIYHESENIILFECQGTLKFIAQEIGMTYQQVADISCSKRKPKRFTQFKFFPKIEILKLEKNTCE